MAVLILAPEDDIHALAVGEHLQGWKVPVRFFSLRQIPDLCRFSFRLGEGGFACSAASEDSTGGGEPDGMTIDFKSFQSIWLRRPGRPRSETQQVERWVLDLSEWESVRALGAIMRLLPGKWVNDPRAEAEALYKVRQLEKARQAGLSVPDTLITNDPHAVREFYRDCKGEVIYKMIDAGSWTKFPAYEIPRGIPTLPVRDADLEHLDQVRASMHLFQRRVSKASDVRVTIVGERVFAAEIHSQEGKGKLDFRLDFSVPTNKIELPGTVRDACLALMRSLGLDFGALDFCKTDSGDYVFLEVNPAGNWLWIERRLDMPISRELAALLRQG